MKIIELQTVTLLDLVITLILCISSIIFSGFPQELSAVFLLSFLWRFIFNYCLAIEQLNPAQTKDGI
jgi:hypothetical protein